jgi:hypothetical protein
MYGSLWLPTSCHLMAKNMMSNIMSDRYAERLGIPFAKLTGF